jgi:DNA ligase 1
MIFDTLFKRTSTGATQVWTLEVEGNQYRVTSGQIDGKQVTSSWTVCEGKNIGRANETSPEEQAMSEAKAKMTKKLDQGKYHTNIENIDVQKFMAPMLAKKYEGKMSEKTFSQPKLDGIRCIVKADGMWTRTGGPILGAPHIREALQEFFNDDPDLILDGELYCSRLKNDFNKIVSLAKKKSPTEQQLRESAHNLQYWVYDLPSSKRGFFERSIELAAMSCWWRDDEEAKVDSPLVLVETELVRNKEHLDELYQGYLAAGQEGQMVRDGNSLYENKRSKGLLKRKEFKDEEFTILCLNEGRGNYAGMIKSVSFETKGGIKFDTGIKGDQPYLRDLMANADQYVGNQATVRYQDLTPDGKPRFGVCYHIWGGDRDC